MKTTIDPTITKAIEHVLNTCPPKYKCRIVKRNNAVWYEFWHDYYREFFIEDTSDGGRCVVFKKHDVERITHAVAMILHCKLIDPNDIEIPL
jgi:hypothetical protein